MKILLVDDEADYRAVMIKRLGKRKVETLEASSGEEALRVLAEQGETGLDAVILDIHMPGMGGLAALEEIRRLYPDLPVLILTARADMTEAVEGLKQGAFCHLLKPVDIETLHWRLCDATYERSLGDEAACPVAVSPAAEPDPASDLPEEEDEQ